MQEVTTYPDINESVVFSVSEVAFHLKQVLDTQIEALYVNGEISSFVRHSSGHMYFSLKDDNAVLRCAFFRNLNYQLDFEPRDGDQVVCFGKLSIFEKSGNLQLIVQNMFPYGKGALQQRFEQLKLKLKTEGLFDREHKKPLPQYPDRIGIITSPTGAALQDILNILTRRYPCQVDVYPSLMQGNDASSQVIKGLEYFNSVKNVDLIIISRGGGSQEDLFCFNDENLARAIYASDLPVVSAIGHEIDFTIADFVADLRAPTPSAATELVTPDKAELDSALYNYFRMMSSDFNGQLNHLFNRIHKNHLRLMQYNPEKVWQNLQQRFDNAVSSMLHFSEVVDRFKRDMIYHQQMLYSSVVNMGKRIVQSKQHRIEIAVTRLSYEMKAFRQTVRHKLDILETSLQELSPVQVMERGYSLVKKDGKIIKSKKQLQVKDDLELVLSDGTAQVEVTSLDSQKKV